MIIEEFWDKYASPISIFYFIEWLYEKIGVQKGTKLRMLFNMIVGFPLTVFWLFGMFWWYAPISLLCMLYMFITSF